MEYSILTHRNLIWVFLIFATLSFCPAKSNPRSTEASQTCDPLQHSPTSNFIPNFITVMQAISDGINIKQWGSFNITSSPPDVYAFAQCYGDLQAADCETCFSASRTKLPRCLPAVSARIFLDGCFLRYDNHSFFHEAVDEEYDKVTCGPLTDFSSDEMMRFEFEKKIRDVIGILADKAVLNGGFAVDENKGGVEVVYGLAQCWRTLQKDQCRQCLKFAGAKLGECAPASEGRAMYTGCYLRYSTEKFFNIDARLDEEGQLSIEFFISHSSSSSFLSFFFFFLLILISFLQI